MTLVKDGDAFSTIVWWGKNNAEIPEFAALELQSYLKKISGATIPVVEAEIEEGAAEYNSFSSFIAIITGEKAEKLAAQDKVEVPHVWLASFAEKLVDVKEDAFTIQTEDDHITLTGMNDRGTLYASYYLLKKIGVQFLAPNYDFYENNSEIIPDLKTVQVKAFDTLEEPDMKLRRKYIEEGWSVNPQNVKELIDWMAKNGLNILNATYDYVGAGNMKWDDLRESAIPELKKRGIDAEVGGHGFESFLSKEKFQAKHPDWFTDDNVVFDVANDDAVQAYVNQVVNYLKERPEIKIFDSWPPDRIVWPDKALEKFKNGSNAYAYVVNKLTDAVHKELPGVRVGAIAYQSHLDPPDEEYMFNKDTIIDYAPIARSQSIPIYEGKNKTFTDIIDQWRNAFDGDFSIYTYYRRYSYHSAPIVLPKLIGEDLPYYQEQGVNGISLYSEPADWLTFELSHLITADMSWDTSIDANQYIKSYIKNRYGIAASEMEKYFDLVEDAGRALFYKPFHSYDQLDNIEKARANYEKAKKELAKAREKVSKDTSTGFMLQRLDWNMDYTQADIDYSYYKLKNDTKNQEIAKQNALKLVLNHRFNGIILQNVYLMERYDDVKNEDFSWAYKMYRGKAALRLSSSLPETVSPEETFEVEATIQNYSQEEVSDAHFHLNVPKEWAINSSPQTKWEKLVADPSETYKATWQVSIPKDANLGTYKLTVIVDYHYKDERKSVNDDKIFSAELQIVSK